MARTHSQRILKAVFREQGAPVCSMAPYEGRIVAYSPRHRSDSHPWVIPGVGYRYSGRECHVHYYEDTPRHAATPG